MREYTNGDGKKHEERRDQWYSNREIFEMMQSLSKDMENYRLEMRKYNGLKEDNMNQWQELKRLSVLIEANENAPCKKIDSWLELNESLKEIKKEVNDLKVTHQTRLKLKEFLITWGGWIAVIYTVLAHQYGWW